MSLNPVSRSLLPAYGPPAVANSSPTARTPGVSNGAPDTTAFRETFTPAASPIGAPGGRYGPAIGLYQRVSQYRDDRATASGLMKSWNDIVRENQFEDAGVASHVKAIAQNDALALPSRVLHLTV